MNKQYCGILTFDPAKNAIQVIHRKGVTHSNGSYERKSRGRKLADEMGRGKKNSHGTLIDWSYLPTPPLGRDMTQGQLLSGV